MVMEKGPVEQEVIPNEYQRGWKEGWIARGEYIKDRKTSIDGSRTGLTLMMLCAMFGLPFAYLSIIAGMDTPGLRNPFFDIQFYLLWLAIAAFGIGGYFLDKHEVKRYYARKKTFEEKWGKD
jgi:hypothetical protein